MGKTIERIAVPNTPKPQGPYSEVIRAGDFLFVSGQGPIDPATNEFSFGDIRHETKLVLQNIQKIVEGCGAKLSDVAKCSVFLADAADFNAMNEVYKTFFGAAPPTRTTVQATLVEPRMKIEVDCIVYLPSSR